MGVFYCCCLFCLVFLCAYMPSVCLVPAEARSGSPVPWDWGNRAVTAVLPCGCWESNLDSTRAASALNLS